MKHITVNVRVSETVEVTTATRTHGDQKRVVTETANVTVRAETTEEAIKKVTHILGAL